MTPEGPNMANTNLGFWDVLNSSNRTDVVSLIVELLVLLVYAVSTERSTDSRGFE